MSTHSIRFVTYLRIPCAIVLSFAIFSTKIDIRQRIYWIIVCFIRYRPLGSSYDDHSAIYLYTFLCHNIIYKKSYRIDILYANYVVFVADIDGSHNFTHHTEQSSKNLISNDDKSLSASAVTDYPRTSKVLIIVRQAFEIGTIPNDPIRADYSNFI